MHSRWKRIWVGASVVRHDELFWPQRHILQVSIVLVEWVVKRKREYALYTSVCEKTQGCGEPRPSHKTRHVLLLRSLIFEPQYSVSPGYLIVMLYTYLLTRICPSALDDLSLVNCLPGVLALVYRIARVDRYDSLGVQCHTLLLNLYLPD